MIANPCPRGCGGSIMPDGTCFLCARSIEVAEAPLLQKKVPQPREHFEGVDPQRMSTNCRARDHHNCGGRRLEDSPMGMRLVPCMCPHHQAPPEIKPRLAGNSTWGQKTPITPQQGQWVTLKADGTKHSAHLLLDMSLVGDPPIYQTMICSLRLTKLDLIRASEGLPRCKRCERKASLEDRLKG